MANPYKEGAGWAFRCRNKGQDVYRSGFPSEAAAKRELAAVTLSIEKDGKPAGLGPERTSVAVAFSDYARLRLPQLKGAEKDANRINRYLRPQKLPVICLKKLNVRENGGTCYFDVTLVAETTRAIPKSLQSHRAQQSQKKQKSEKVRARIASMPVAEVTTYHVQQLIDAMIADGYSPATIDHERAELRRLFNFTRKNWHWAKPARNPASDVSAPTVNNARNRVLSNAEWENMAEALGKYPNDYVIPLFDLMLETAMRSCEPLTYACWGDINWEREVIALYDAKAGKRDVPLNPKAIHILRALEEFSGEPGPSAQIFTTTYEAVKKAWSVARKACGLDDIQIHDLRHTATTRYAIEYNGNIAILKIITGHKTISQLMRYINLTADDVVRMMHGRPLNHEDAPAGYTGFSGQSDSQPVSPLNNTEGQFFPTRAPVDKSSNVITVVFGKKAA